VQSEGNTGKRVFFFIFICKAKHFLGLLFHSEESLTRQTVADGFKVMMLET
jgi:hypothetical protein